MEISFDNFDNSELTADANTGWVDVVKNQRKHSSPMLLLTSWKDAAGTLDGTIKWYTTNDTTNNTTGFLLQSLTVDSADSAEDEGTLEIATPLRYIKGVYTENNMTSVKIIAKLFTHEGQGV